jgi:hypothetical protein
MLLLACHRQVCGLAVDASSVVCTRRDIPLHGVCATPPSSMLLCPPRASYPTDRKQRITPAAAVTPTAGKYLHGSRLVSFAVLPCGESTCTAHRSPLPQPGELTPMIEWAATAIPRPRAFLAACSHPAKCLARPLQALKLSS